jgi:hypothetical protein
MSSLVQIKEVASLKGEDVILFGLVRAITPFVISLPY